MRASGRSHQIALRLVTRVEDHKILLLLTHVRHTEVCPDRVRKELSVVRLLRALDIHHLWVDLRFRRISRSLVPRILCSKYLRPIHRLEVAIKRCRCDPLVRLPPADQPFDCKDMCEQKVIRRLSVLKDQRSIREVFS